MTSRVRPLTIVVLLGGPSAEREVSLVSGRCVADALARRGHRVIELDPTPHQLPFRPTPAAPIDLPRAMTEARRRLQQFDWPAVDVVFNALHGTFGEDGTVQEILDSLGIPYTGSDAEASRCGFHKWEAKRRFEAYGLRTPRAVLFRTDWPASRIEAAAQSLKWPVVVKPEAQGSSLGVSVVRRPEDLPGAARRCAVYGAVALLEEYIAGTEWTAPVWDDFVLPLIEIVPAQEFFDYAAKYTDERTAYRFCSHLPEETMQRIALSGRRAARAVGAEGLARVDVRVDAAGVPWVLEVNTSPGMTDHSLTPKAAARMGLSLGVLCEQECRRAIERRRKRLTAAA
jgi:D-alanine-D-alanine ligase